MKTYISHVIFIKIAPTKPHLTQPNLTVEKENTKNRKKSKKNYVFFFLCKFGISMRNCIFDVIFIKIGLYVWNAKCPSCSFVVRKCQKKNQYLVNGESDQKSVTSKEDRERTFLPHPPHQNFQKCHNNVCHSMEHFFGICCFFTLIN